VGVDDQSELWGHGCGHWDSWLTRAPGLPRIQDGKTTQISSNQIDAKLRDDLERLKKIRNHRGLRHYWGLRVRGQHTKTTGRRGKTVGVSKKKG